MLLVIYAMPSTLRECCTYCDISQLPSYISMLGCMALTAPHSVVHGRLWTSEDQSVIDGKVGSFPACMHNIYVQMGLWPAAPRLEAMCLQPLFSCSLRVEVGGV